MRSRRHHLALELAQARAIVAAGEARHLFADLCECERSHRDCLLRLDVDADAAQPIGVELAREHWGVSRFRQNHLLHPRAMCGQLRREALVRAFPVLHAAAAEELGDAVAVAPAIAEVLAHFAFVRPDDARLLEALAHAGLRELGERRRVLLHAGIAAHAHERVALPRRGIACIEQRLQPLKDLLGQVEIRHQQALLEAAGAAPAFDRVDQDLEVLRDPRVLLGRLERGEALDEGAAGRDEALAVARPEVEHRRIEALQAVVGRLLGVEGAHRLEDERRVAVAALDPRFLGDGGAAKREPDEKIAGLHRGDHSAKRLGRKIECRDVRRLLAACGRVLRRFVSPERQPGLVGRRDATFAHLHTADLLDLRLRCASMSTRRGQAHSSIPARRRAFASPLLERGEHESR